ncbi:MAG: aminopeptidase P family protein, partial [Nitratireductor sp.]|nr:aminopeptidase P family protein [Nitratireductor sp.]
MLDETLENRIGTFTCHNGEKAALPFTAQEYDRRLAGLRSVMAARGIDAVLFTSMHNIAYYSGFLYCSFGRPYGCVVTQDDCTTVSANIDAGQPWRRSVGDNVIFTDWKRNNYWRAVGQLMKNARRIGIETDHMTLAARDLLAEFLGTVEVVDIAADTMAQRMVKSAEEIALIRQGATVADVGGEAIHAAIREGASELEIAMEGRNAMEREIAARFPSAEYRDTWVWFQSGI